MMSARVTSGRREAFLAAQREADERRDDLRRRLLSERVTRAMREVPLIPGQRDIFDCLAEGSAHLSPFAP